MNESAMSEREALSHLAQNMPGEPVQQVLDFVFFLQRRRLLEIPGYSDVWTEEDLREWMSDGFEEMEQECP